VLQTGIAYSATLARQSITEAYIQVKSLHLVSHSSL